jgi:predicted nucleic acid-binding protein
MAIAARSIAACSWARPLRAHSRLPWVLPRLGHRHGLSAHEIDDLINALSILAELVDPDDVEENELADAADLPVLGTLVAARSLGLAQALVTGDKALLTLRERYPICTPAEFWASHGGG